MAKQLPLIEESLAGELFNHWIDFISEKGGIPIERAFWRWLIRRKKYTVEQLPEHTFRWQFGRLIDEGWIKIDGETRSLIPVRDVKITVHR